jgi:hypothetical protein
MRSISSILAVVSSLSLALAAPVANVKVPDVHVPENDLTHYDLTHYDRHTAYPKGAHCGALICADVTLEIITKKKHGEKHCGHYHGHPLLCADVDVSLLGHGDNGHHDNHDGHHGKKDCGALACVDVNLEILKKKKHNEKWCKANILCADIDISLLGIDLASIDADVSLLDGHHGGHGAPQHDGSQHDGHDVPQHDGSQHDGDDVPHHGGPHHGNEMCGAIRCADITPEILKKKKHGDKWCKADLLCLNVDLSVLGINLLDLNLDVDAPVVEELLEDVLGGVLGGL